MRRLPLFILFSAFMLSAISMHGSLINLEANSQGVVFVNKSLSETFVLAKNADKLVLLDAFSFN